MSEISENEDDIDFQRAMSDVTPLNQDKHKQFTAKVKLKKKSPSQRLDPAQHAAYDYDFNLISQENWVGGEDNVLFKQTGIQKKIMDNLRRGTYPIEAHIDLHRLTCGEAMALVDRFIEQCISADIRSVLMIHGKGTMSRSEKPILKNMLIEHLRQNLNVLAYHSARPKDGGTGALYVLIKASHKV